MKSLDLGISSFELKFLYPRSPRGARTYQSLFLSGNNYIRGCCPWKHAKHEGLGVSSFEVRRLCPWKPATTKESINHLLLNENGRGEPTNYLLLSGNRYISFFCPWKHPKHEGLGISSFEVRRLCPWKPATTKEPTNLFIKWE